MTPRHVSRSRQVSPAPCRDSAMLPGPPMRLLYSYLKDYRWLVALALGLAAVNQVFSLLDPLIFRYVIDNYATRHDQYTTARVLLGRAGSARRGRGRRVRLARGQELPGLLHQRRHAAAGRAPLQRRHPALARPAVPGVRGPAQRRDAGQAAEGADGRRAPRADVHQRVVHHAGRHPLRDGVRLQRPLDHRARLPVHRAAARDPQFRAEPAHQGDPEGHRARRRRRWRDRPPSRCATSSW